MEQNKKIELMIAISKEFGYNYKESEKLIEEFLKKIDTL